MSWTSPRTWVAGELVTASLLNTHIRDNEAYLKDAPTFDGNVAVTGTLNVTGTTTLGALTVATPTVSGTLTPQALIDASGASAGQIKFPASQNASADANTLDDYEEGTWTPVLGGDGGTSGQTYAVQVGRYVKIGRLVHAQFRVQLSVLGTVSGSVQIQGLPFTSENVAELSSSGSIGRFITFTTAFAILNMSIIPNQNAAYLWGATSAATGLGVLSASDLANGTYIEGTLLYRATA